MLIQLYKKELDWKLKKLLLKAVIYLINIP